MHMCAGAATAYLVRNLPARHVFGGIARLREHLLERLACATTEQERWGLPSFLSCRLGSMRPEHSHLQLVTCSVADARASCSAMLRTCGSSTGHVGAAKLAPSPHWRTADDRRLDFGKLLADGCLELLRKRLIVLQHHPPASSLFCRNGVCLDDDAISAQQRLMMPANVRNPASISYSSKSLNLAEEGRVVQVCAEFVDVALVNLFVTCHVASSELETAGMGVSLRSSW